MAKYTPEGIFCVVTGKPAEYHHVKPRGSGGTDDEWNLCPVAREIHTLWHSKGNSYMCQHFPQIKKWMQKHGWTLCPVLHKWRHDGKNHDFKKAV